MHEAFGNFDLDGRSINRKTKTDEGLQPTVDWSEKTSTLVEQISYYELLLRKQEQEKRQVNSSVTLYQRSEEITQPNIIEELDIDQWTGWVEKLYSTPVDKNDKTAVEKEAAIKSKAKIILSFILSRKNLDREKRIRLENWITKMNQSASTFEFSCAVLSRDAIGNLSDSTTQDIFESVLKHLCEASDSLIERQYGSAKEGIFTNGFWDLEQFKTFVTQNSYEEKVALVDKIIRRIKVTKSPQYWSDPRYKENSSPVETLNLFLARMVIDSITDTQTIELIEHIATLAAERNVSLHKFWDYLFSPKETHPSKLAELYASYLKTVLTKPNEGVLLDLYEMVKVAIGSSVLSKNEKIMIVNLLLKNYSKERIIQSMFRNNVEEYNQLMGDSKSSNDLHQ